MDEEENVTLCTAAIVVRKSPHSLSLVLVVFSRFIIKTMLVHVQSHQSLTFLSSPLVCGHIYIPLVETFLSARGHTHKHNHVFKYLLFDWLAHSTKFDEVG